MKFHTPSPDAETAGTRPAQALADFAAGLDSVELPQEVRSRACLHILDGLGLGLASREQPFATAALAGIDDLGGNMQGGCTVIGRATGMAARDAALANGILIHGLDFDDTHQAAIVHPTAASLPAALAVAEQRGLSGEALLGAYCIGMEAAIRIGAAVKGGFHHAGFHATGVVAHFASALAAGRLLGLDPAALVSAQGIAASTASGVQVFLEEGAWTKRFHPGWAAVAGITAAHLAGRGFCGPSRPYEGTFGLFESHLQAHADDAELGLITEGLGTVWRMAETALKPYPVCHFIHGCAEAAIVARDEIGSAEIETIDILLPEKTLPIVAEPAEAKRNAQTEYEAKFSAPFVVATCLLRGRFGLAELTPEAIAAADVQALARRTRCLADPDSAFPTYFSGGVRLHLSDGRVIARHIPINSGAGDRQMDATAVVGKFMANAEPVLGEARAERLCDAVLGIGQATARDLGACLRG
jgi:2-methylcitrate dehydratase PrpD